jgi:EAL domain-containing protein (putative c-di-GMP-specific phosphodiesterase class I)
VFGSDEDSKFFQGSSHEKPRIMVADQNFRSGGFVPFEIGEIRQGLAASEFEPFFQPVTSLADGKVVGFEALARWRHPQRGLVAPADFIGIAEGHGFIREIDALILDRAWSAFDRIIETYPQSGAPLTLSVNLSADHLRDDAIVDRVRGLIAAGRGRRSRLQFEITETLRIADIEIAGDVLCKIKDLGVSIALDDFGTGYSSLVYLHRFPIDSIKIDRSFSEAIIESQRSRAIIRAIIGLARSMDLRTVAEGIEEQAVADALRLVGCDFGQGTYFSRPMSEADLTAMLAGKSA